MSGPRPLLLALAVCLVAVSGACGAGADVRPPAVAGQFYPSDRGQLELAVKKLLQAALPPPPQEPVAIVAPHAGYPFSGQIAADAFACARGHEYEVVVILGVNHTVAGFRGIALPGAASFRTPLGEVKIDEKTVASLLAADKDARVDPRPHEREHSIEVEIPFVQHLFPRATILPAVVGTRDLEVCKRFGKALAKALSGRKALIVASSDLSHYPKYEDACRVDPQTLEAMASLDPARLHSAVAQQETRSVPSLATCACGEASVLSALAAARALGATHGVVVSYANSGDTLLAERGRVVGYGAVAFFRGKGKTVGAAPSGPPAGSADDPLTQDDRKALLSFARRSIEQFLSTRTIPLPRGFSPRLKAKQGAFVTLKKKGVLRGCIGHMAEDLPLAQAVGSMALQAAFNDRRFPQLSAPELPNVEIEISVLTPLKPVGGVKDIVVGRDGVVLRKSGRSAVFLPQVAPEQGWSRDEMLDHLCRKAGLAAGSWKEGAQFSTFQAIVFHEPDESGSR